MEWEEELCFDALNVFTCKNGLVWVLKTVVFFLIVISSFFFARSLLATKGNFDTILNHTKFWIYVIISELLHLYGSLLHFTHKSQILLYLINLAMGEVYLTASHEAITFMQRAFPNASKYARYFAYGLEAVIGLTVLGIMIMFWAAPEQDSVLVEGLVMYTITLGMVSRMTFIWSIGTGFIANRRFDWTTTPKVRSIVKVCLFIFALFSMGWIAFSMITEYYDPNMARIWLGLDQEQRREGYIYMMGVLDFTVNDLALILAAVIVEAIIWADKRETNCGVDRENAMNSIMRNVVVE